MINNDPFKDAMTKRLMEKADSMGYRLVPKTATNLWCITIRFPDNEEPRRLITLIRDHNYTVVDAKRL